MSYVDLWTGGLKTGEPLDPELDPLELGEEKAWLAGEINKGGAFERQI